MHLSIWISRYNSRIVVNMHRVELCAAIGKLRQLASHSFRPRLNGAKRQTVKVLAPPTLEVVVMLLLMMSQVSL